MKDCFAYSFANNDGRQQSFAGAGPRAAQMVGPGPPLFEALFKIQCCQKIMVIVGFNYLPRQLSRTHDGINCD